MKEKVITEVRITEMPKTFFDPMPQIFVKLGDDEEVLLFDFYPDEIRFSADELTGLTLEKARSLKGKKDRHYLTS